MKAEKPKLRDDFGNAREIIAEKDKEIKRLKEEKEYFISQNRLNSLEVIRLKKEKEEIYADIIHEGHIKGVINRQVRQALSDLKGKIDDNKTFRWLLWDEMHEVAHNSLKYKKQCDWFAIESMTDEAVNRTIKKVLELLEEK